MKYIKKRINKKFAKLFLRHYGKKSLNLPFSNVNEWASFGTLSFYGVDPDGNFISIDDVNKKDLFMVSLRSSYTGIKDVRTKVDYHTIESILMSSLNKDLESLTSIHKFLLREDEKKSFNTVLDFMDTNHD